MPERQRRHVEQQHVLDVALEHAALDGRADRHDLIGVDAAMGLAPEELLHRLDDLGHAGHAADQDHLVDLGGLEAGVLEGRAAGLDGLLDQLVDQRLELGAGQLDVQMLRPVLIGGDEGQVDLGLGRARQLDLRLLGRFLQALKGEPVLAQVDALLLFELVGEIVDDPGVEILAAQEGVAVGRLHLEDAVADLQDRDVEGAAAQVIDRDGAGALLLEAVGERRRRRLVDDAQHLEAGDAAGVLGRLALGIVEIGGHGDDRLGHLLAEIGLGGLFHLLQDEGADLRGRIFLAAAFDPGIAIVAGDDLIGHQPAILLGQRIVEAPADQALDGKEGVFRIGDGLALGGLADQPLAGVGEGDHGGRRARALAVLDHLDVLAFHDGNAGIGGAEVDTDDFTHVSFFPGRCSPRARMAAPWAIPINHWTRRHI